MSYSESDYRIISTYHGGMFKEDILNGAKVSIKGATFHLERVYIGEKATSIFKFTTLNEFVDGDPSKPLIEIGWDTCSFGLLQIANALKLKYQSGASYFSNGDNSPIFIDEVEV